MQLLQSLRLLYHLISGFPSSVFCLYQVLFPGTVLSGSIFVVLILVENAFKVFFLA